MVGSASSMRACVPSTSSCTGPSCESGGSASEEPAMQPETVRLDVEVSLVNTNNRDLLRSCLASLPHAAGALAWHATVVDNASDDGSPEVVRTQFPWARLIENSRRAGFSANHNRV